MVEKIYHLALYLGPFGAYLMPQGSKGVPIYQNDCWNMEVNSHYLPYGKKKLETTQKKSIWLIILTIYHHSCFLALFGKVKLLKKRSS